MALKKISGGNSFINALGFDDRTLSEFLMDGDTDINDLPVDDSVVVGSQALKLNEGGQVNIFIFGPSRRWYPYYGVSFLS